MKFMTMTILPLLFGVNVSANAQRPIIDDLLSMPLRVEKTKVNADIHYPNYRMGGGTGPSRQIKDCLVLDILDSDHITSLELKETIADQIRVLEGFGPHMDEYIELLPTIKNNKVVFSILPRSFYVQTLHVETKSGNTLKEEIDKLMPSTRVGNQLSRVNLLYVRDCRL